MSIIILKTKRIIKREGISGVFEEDSILWRLVPLSAYPEFPEMEEFQHGGPSIRGCSHACLVGQFSHVNIA